MRNAFLGNRRGIVLGWRGRHVSGVCRASVDPRGGYLVSPGGSPACHGDAAGVYVCDEVPGDANWRRISRRGGRALSFASSDIRSLERAPAILTKYCPLEHFAQKALYALEEVLPKKG